MSGEIVRGQDKLLGLKCSVLAVSSLLCSSALESVESKASSVDRIPGLVISRAGLALICEPSHKTRNYCVPFRNRKKPKIMGCKTPTEDQKNG